MYPEAFENWYKRHCPLEQKQIAYQQWLEATKPKLRSKKKKSKGQRKKERKERKAAKKVTVRSRRTNYVKYIKSEAWISKSRKWRKETPNCELCGSDQRLECHHKHYKTLGKETREDILVVCHQCHCKLHNVDEFNDKR